jgi:hypothetical protein
MEKNVGQIKTNNKFSEKKSAFNVLELLAGIP